MFTQFFGAFNDNAWKLVVALLAMRLVSAELGESGPAVEAAFQRNTTLAFVALTLPLMLFSLPAGALADRVSKRRLIIVAKVLELLLMSAATASLVVDPTNRLWAMSILALMGVQSALFSPAKYGILPEIVPHERLSATNGLMEMWTFLAIIAGTGAGGWLLAVSGTKVWLVGAVLTTFSVVGLSFSFTIPRVPPARTSGSGLDALRGAVSAIRLDRMLTFTVLGMTSFWAVASLLGQSIFVYAKSALALPDSTVGLPMAAFGIGVGGGSVLAGRLSGAKVETGLIPLGAIGLSIFTLLLGILAPAFGGTMVLMVLLGVSSGFLVVPLQSLLQWRAPADRRGAVIAVSNVLIFGGILSGSLGAQALSFAGLSQPGIITSAGAAVVLGTILLVWFMPDTLLRLFLVILTHTFYRLRVVGRSHVPETGGALLVPNHVSIVDGLFMIASLDRQVRFIVEATYYERRLLHPFLKALGAIPISASRGPRVVLRALRDAGRYLDEGSLVCIFAEGQMTRTGMMLPFRRGLERIAKGHTAPIIPVHLDRVWGSIFSREGGRFLTKVPRQIPYRIVASYGEPMRSGTTIPEIRQAVMELAAAAAVHRKQDARPLHHGFIRAARRRPFRLAFADMQRGSIGRFKALTSCIAIARALRPHWSNQLRVGVLLPPSVPGALVNMAASLCGRTSVNLNYTTGKAGMESAAKQASLHTVVTSRVFLEKAGLELPAGVVPLWIEDLVGGIGRGQKAKAFLLALLAPISVLQRACGCSRRPSIDDVATIIFSSGSTGEPKGIMLSHWNVGSNVDALAQVFELTSSERMLGILPCFHAFGYLALWFCARRGLGMVCHPNPIDAGAIGELVQTYRVTMLLATPTFLQVYLRRCTPAQFGSLLLVVTGAEKLSERLCSAFEDQFGIRPLEGYGTTECSPVVAVSTRDFRAPGFYQPGSRRGFVGHPLPGVAVRIVDPDTHELRPAGTDGMLLVKGANVMLGYLGRDDLTDAVMHDGWYITGDIAVASEDGFLKITDRLSRFAKIGGEMVPHGRVEEALEEAAGEDTRQFAVTSLPDDRKGERLAVLHTLDETAIPAILEQVKASGLPNLFIPRSDQFVRVEQIPILGTGKPDLRAIRRIAAEALGASS